MSRTSPSPTMLAFAKIDEEADASDDWTFRHADTRSHVHSFHDYPARMIPQIADRLICEFGTGAKLLFDPYCGTGTSLVESMLHGVSAVGTDLNPLARLIARVKTSRPNLTVLDRALAQLQKDLAKNPLGPEVAAIDGISQLDFWFKPQVIRKLSWIRDHLNGLSDDTVRDFLKVAFSETVRECSNTRTSEFKLYRYASAKLTSFDPDVFGSFLGKTARNRIGLEEFLRRLVRTSVPAEAKVWEFNSVTGVPESAVVPETVDLVLTSPPYGDSRTTVAYGQYSRLSAAWLGLDEPHNIDQRLMGGSRSFRAAPFPCASLNAAINEIGFEHEKRAREVVAFYADLHASISNVACTVKPGGYACYVVGNRKVKGVVLPTSDVIRDFFLSLGFKHIDTYVRSIPNKRMPSQNSPSNKTGELDATMTAEYVVVMQK